jgi:hypothetical protein
MDFLKPNVKKIVLYIILLIIFLSLEGPYICELDIGGSGYCRPGKGLPWSIGYKEIKGKLIFSRLILDLIFWYFASCFIVWVFNTEYLNQAERKISRLSIGSLINFIIFLSFLFTNLGGFFSEHWEWLFGWPAFSFILAIISIIFAIENKTRLNFKISLILSIISFILCLLFIGYLFLGLSLYYRSL